MTEATRAGSTGCGAASEALYKSFRIDPEFATLCPLLSDEERALLEASIVAEGCRDPLVVGVIDGDRLLVDGHNREAICRTQGVFYRTVEREFATREAARSWIIDNALGRRNLTREQRDYLIGKRYAAEKKPHGGAREASPQSEDMPKTSERIAKTAGVSRATVERAAEFAEAVDTIAANVGPKARNEILAGKVKLTRAQVKVAADKGVRTMKDLRSCAKAARPPRAAPRAKPEEAPARSFAGLYSAADSLAREVAAARVAVEETEGVVPGVVAALDPLRRLRSEIDALITSLAGQE